MPYNKLSTSRIAQAVGCHPNTVRLYEQWGFLQPVARNPAGYRLYTPAHLAQMRLARTALNSPWPGRAIRRSVSALVRQAASGDLGGALESAYRHLALVQSEIAHAEAAASLLERWAQGAPADATQQPLSIRQAADLLGLTPDTLRNWEANGLLRPPRNSYNRYRIYHQPEIARLRVIRMLRNSGYSLMSILRMLLQLDQGQVDGLRQALDTPRPDEDILYAADHWLTTLREQEQRAHQLISLIEERLHEEPV